MADDSRARVISRSLVKASASSVPSAVLPVSNLDLLPQSAPNSLFCIYRKPSSGAFGDVVAAFRARLPIFLNHFFPFAGRVVANLRTGVPELHCANQGAELVVVEVGMALAGLDYGVLGSSLASIGVPVRYAADVALSVQLVSFACGGFAVAWGSSHLLVDGHALCMMASTWSELARSGTVSAAPSHDRPVFRARAPPAYSASLDKEFTPLHGGNLVNALTAEAGLVERFYYIAPADLAELRAQAGRGATRVEAVSAYLWKVFAAVVGTADDSCRMCWWVDGRRRLAAPRYRAAMRNYIGNVTTLATAEASVEAILRLPQPEVAALIKEAIAARATGEHFQELVDWVEEHRGTKYIETASVGLGSPVVGVSSFTSFPLDTDFGFGHAAIAIPTMADGARLCTGFLQFIQRPGGDGTWIVTAFLWPSLAAAIESDEHRIFKPLTAGCLGLQTANPQSRL